MAGHGRLPQTIYRIAGTLMREITKSGHEEYTYFFHRDQLSYLYCRLPDGSRFSCDNDGAWMDLHDWDGNRVFGLSWWDADDLVKCESALAMCRRAINGPPQEFDEIEREFISSVQRCDPMEE